jgi:dTDP-4-amino-4,6-dideoxygalactose transaminase
MRGHLAALIPWWATDFGEADIARVTAAIRNRHISQGPITREFEERLAEILGVPYVVCTSSGTTALTMALLAADIGYGSEVIVPNRTWIATAHAVMMTGAKVVLADVNERGLLHVEQCVYEVLPVNLNGRFVEIPKNSLVIEDSCQAFPKPPASLAACYSMSTAKLLPTGQGGFVATRDEALYKELKALRTHDVADAMVPQVLKWRRFGYNFRYNDILASIGLAQLERLSERTARLHEIRTLYAASLPSFLELLPCDGVPLYTEVLYADSERLRAYLLDHGIQARPNYPSLNTAPYLNDSRCFPNSERFEHGLTLPSGPAQTNANIKKTLECLHDFR